MAQSNSSTASGGVGIGVVIAALLSWSTHHSILWVIVNGLFGWLYVIYWWIYYSSSAQ